MQRATGGASHPQSGPASVPSDTRHVPSAHPTSATFENPSGLVVDPADRGRPGWEGGHARQPCAPPGGLGPGLGLGLGLGWEGARNLKTLTCAARDCSATASVAGGSRGVRWITQCTSISSQSSTAATSCSNLGRVALVRIMHGRSEVSGGAKVGL